MRIALVGDVQQSPYHLLIAMLYARAPVGLADALAAVQREVTEWICAELRLPIEMEPTLDDLRCAVERRAAPHVQETFALLSDVMTCVDAHAAHELSSRRFASATTLLRHHRARIVAAAPVAGPGRA